MMEFNAVDKYRSMLRSYGRLKKIETDNGNNIGNTESRDAVEDFFNQCYHFKDWLKKDKSIVLSFDVEKFISEGQALSLAADYCNTFKHAGLGRARSDKNLEKINTHINFDLTPRGVIASSRLELTISGEKYDAFKLALNVLKIGKSISF
ncbi:MAG: hypothetical protein COU72_04080 [Parcubacteria group bacterium CG10_big_fil_rev_8_21_14_0_10_41_35]|nr:MAG: hypothetical protein COU72_04080 [Parcubacteria group bacterium CG10_big_fil_rev_8_21_14_0_10_41_35]